MKLIKSQKNELAKLLSENGINPTYFEFTEVENGFVIRNKTETNWFFQAIKTHQFDLENIKFFPCPFDDNKLRFFSSFENIIEHFTEWSQYLQQEINTVDLWSTFNDELSSNRQFFENTTSFTPQQLLQIQNGIDEIKVQLA
jgi:hypothetical protein